MKILSSIKDDVWHQLGDASYEWWYFDAIDQSGDQDGYSLVITFFYGLPFSPFYNKAIEQHQKHQTSAPPGNHAALYFCLYGPNKTDCYLLNEYQGSSFQAAKDKPLVNIGSSKLHYDKDQGFIVEIDAPALRAKHVKAKLVFQPQLASMRSFASFGDQQPDDHVWNCVAPHCRVQGEVEIKGLFSTKRVLFNGQGYHDHNYGVRPMHHDMLRWHWGRLHSPEFTSIYYLVETPQQQREGMLAAIDHNGEAIYCGPIDWYADLKRHFMGLSYYPSIVMTSKDSKVKLNIDHHRFVDQGPFYLRFHAQQQLQFDNKKYGGIGFAEAFEPQRLFIKPFWPFIKMRIRKLA